MNTPPDLQPARPTVPVGLLVVVVCVLGIVDVAQAEVRRYALLIGANEGSPDEKPLRYAVRDAKRVSDVLKNVGGVLSENIVVLSDPDAAEVERVLKDLNTRIEAGNAKAGNNKSILFVYYSGHADATALHLGPTLLDNERLRRLVGTAPARMRVMVIDACRSGELTRVKGAKPTRPFKIDASGRLEGEGLAIITSSAAGEDALESERLGGSFFTHHFINGLLGPADRSGDKRVTLTEAYKYAYVETLRTTSRADFIQHPTYSFRLKGREELILAFLDKTHKGYGQLSLESRGTYVFFAEDAEGELIAEMTVKANTEVMLATGTYLVRRIGDKGVFESEVYVPQSGRAQVRVEDMARIPTSQVVRKGLDKEGGFAWALSAQGQFTGELIPDTGLPIQGAVGMQFDFGPLSLQTRLRLGVSSANNTTLNLDQRFIGLDAAALKLFDIGPLSLGFGLRLGVGWLEQRFDSLAPASDRSGLVPFAGALLHTSWAFTPWLGLFAEGAAEAYGLPIEDTETGASAMDVRLVPQASLGLLIYLP